MADVDICDQKLRQVAIKAAIELRKAKGLPEERNITVLYEEVAPLLGLSVLRLRTGRDGNHLPAPHEMKGGDGTLLLPKHDCPSCGTKESMVLFPLCQSCTDAEGGKYKTMWQCQQCKVKERSEKAFVQWLDEFGIEIPRGATKESLGIKTVTDDGLK